MDKKVREETKELLSKFKRTKDNLIVILEEVQTKFGYVPRQAQLEIQNQKASTMYQFAWVQLALLKVQRSY